MKLALDTNVVLYALGGKIALPIPSGRYFLSAISVMELLSYPSLSEEESQKIHVFLQKVTVVHITPAIIQKTIEIRRQYLLKIPDSIIAATAIVEDAFLVTNDLDFYKINGLRYHSVAIT